MTGPPTALLRRTAAEVMIAAPKTLLCDATVDDVRAVFEDSHVHLALLVRDRTLVGTLRRADLAPSLAGDSPALAIATTAGRIVAPDTRMADAHAWLVSTRQRRLAVVDPAQVLLGLLCLKRDGSGYCTDDGVAARAGERAC